MQTNNKPATKTKARKSLTPQADLAQRHLGIAAKLCLKYYRYLPNDVKSYYDLDDMIADVVLHVFKKSSQYNSSKSKESTWVWHVVDNKCKSILGHFQTKQYTAMQTVELPADISEKLQVGTRRESEAKNAVERMIQYGSDEVRDFLDRIFNAKPIKLVPAYELQQLAKQYSVSLTDLMIVLHSVVE